MSDYTKALLQTKCEQLVDLNIESFKENIMAKVTRIIDHGAVDTDKLNSDQGHVTAIAKIILSIFFEEQSKQFFPVSPDYQAEKKNIEKFI